MATAIPPERLQPALLDRLVDNRRRYLPSAERLPASALGQAALSCVAARTQVATTAGMADAVTRPGHTASPPAGSDEDPRVMTWVQLRKAVLRDLNWLFNAVQMMSGEQAEAMPRVAESVLNYGLPALSGMQASDVDIPWLERTLKRAILAFEPRLVPAALRVKAVEFNSVMDTHNVIEFEITGELWAWGRPIELLLRTKVDLEAGQVVVRDPAERRTPATS